MADQLGAFEVGVQLRLDELLNSGAQTRDILKAVEASINGVGDATKKTNESSAGFAIVKFNAGLQVAQTALEGVRAGFEAVHRVAEKVMHIFDEVVHESVHWSNQLVNQSALLGIGVEQMQAFRAGLETTGATADAATGIFRRFTLAVGAATGTGSGMGVRSGAKAFQELKVSLIDTTGHVRPMEQVLNEVSAALMKMPEGPRRTALAMAIFGRQGGQMLSTFKELSEHGENWEQHLKRLGLVIDADVIEHAAKLDSLLDTLKVQAETTWRAIGAEAAPAFIPFIQKLVDMRAAVLHFVTESGPKIEEFARTLADELSTLLDVMGRLVTQLMGTQTATTAFDDVITFLKYEFAELNLEIGRTLMALDLVKRAATFQLNIFNPDQGMSEVGKIGKALAEQSQARMDAVKAEAFERTAVKATSAEVEHLVALLHNVKAAGPTSPVIVANGLLEPGADAKVLAAFDRLKTALGELQGRTGYLTEETRKWLTLAAMIPEIQGPPAPPKKEPERDVGTDPEAKKAEDAIKKMITGLKEEEAALMGGTAAKLAAKLETDAYVKSTGQARDMTNEFAHASEASKQKVIAEALALERMQQSVQHLTELFKDFQDQEKQAIADRDRSLNIRKESIQAALTQAKVDHDDQGILRLTTQLAATEAQQRINTEQDAVNHLQELLGKLTDARSKDAQEAVQIAVKEGRDVSGEGDQQVINLRGQLQDELALRQDQLVQVQALTQQQTANTLQAAQDEVNKMRGVLFDLKATMATTINDMFEGWILGTQKMSQVWKSMWASLEKTGIQTMTSLILNQFTALDKPVALNLGSLGGLFSGGGGGAAKVPTEVPGGGPPAPAAEATGIFSGVTKAFANLTGGGAKAPGAPADVGTMTVNAGTVMVNGAGGGGTPGEGEQPGGPNMTPVEGGGAMTPAGEPKPAAAGGGEAESQKQTSEMTTAIQTMGSGIKESVEGIGSIFEGVGSTLLQPLELIPHMLTKGFQESIKTFNTGIHEGGKSIKEGAQHTVAGVAHMGQALGMGLSAIGGLIGGKAGAIVSLIGEIISSLFSIVVAITLMDTTFISTLWSALGTFAAAIIAGGTKFLGTGQSGGYITPSGLQRPGGRAAGDSVRGTVPLLTHPDEGLINPEATKILGGKAAIMALNAGRLPPGLAQVLADGIRVPLPTPALPPGSGQVTQQLNHTEDNSVNIHPGAITVHVPPGTDGDTFTRDMLQGVISHFRR